MRTIARIMLSALLAYGIGIFVAGGRWGMGEEVMTVGTLFASHVDKSFADPELCEDVCIKFLMLAVEEGRKRFRVTRSQLKTHPCPGVRQDRGVQTFIKFAK